MADVFGYTPQKATLILSPGADFIHTITPTSGTFPAGMTAAIKLYARGSDTVLATWAGTVTSGQITWTIQSNTATTGVDATPTLVALHSIKISCGTTVPFNGGNNKWLLLQRFSGLS
ncbi:hypothetical protein HOT82_gp060 [Gordonia phage Ronaldo]|uniref:LtfC/p132/Gp6 beta-sandwich domain-containing protein n=1 Tax=Gordonia phage Ronaldo TaxID=2250397 RepID=A0A346FD08_9CAUD|nr:hypothetical protein HOT82_gp060 [Gordonia phage Ronaldo]AXN53622.1 hypothetical protein SEA_RONALDO_60 [Gordonia phage Ronaldo]